MPFLRESNLHPQLDGFFEEKGLKTATLIQKRVIPDILGRKSVIVLSETGSGKTLAYALPIASKIKEREERVGRNEVKGAPYALIVAPTRELANQIFQVFKGISYHLKVRVRDLTGGDTSAKMKSVASGSYEILIATPSRVKSALQKKELQLGQLQYVIFDEADQLFDKGFKKDLDFMIEYFDKSAVQFGFITATLPEEVETYIMEKFAEVKFSRIASDVSHAPQSKVETYNVKVEPEEKPTIVRMFLEKQAKGRGIIFTNQQNQAEDLFKYLSEKMPKLKMKLLHGNLEIKEREAAIRAFVEKKVQILVATDIAARGIDIPDLEWVVNFGLPKTGIYYLHRCGRVGRGGRSGVVYNLVAHHDSKMISMINQAISQEKHLNLSIIPEEKMKAEKKVYPKKAKKAATFRGQEEAQEPKRKRGKRDAPTTKRFHAKEDTPAAPKRNRGIRRR
jgi:superfamily II DNA/RNA helicase